MNELAFTCGFAGWSSRNPPARSLFLSISCLRSVLRLYHSCTPQLRFPYLLLTLAFVFPAS